MAIKFWNLHDVGLFAIDGDGEHIIPLRYATLGTDTYEFEKQIQDEKFALSAFVDTEKYDAGDLSGNVVLAKLNTQYFGEDDEGYDEAIIVLDDVKIVRFLSIWLFIFWVIDIWNALDSFIWRNIYVEWTDITREYDWKDGGIFPSEFKWRGQTVKRNTPIVARIGRIFYVLWKKSKKVLDILKRIG